VCSTEDIYKSNGRLKYNYLIFFSFILKDLLKYKIINIRSIRIYKKEVKIDGKSSFI
jgi:hypothetical protein